MAVLVALSLVAVSSIVAFALDGGLLLDHRRRAQAAADAAALAAADDLYTNWYSNQGVDKSGTAKASALATAAADKFNNDGVTSTVTVNIPPVSGNAIGQAGYAEVIIQYNQSRAFSSIFGAGKIPVKGRAVARGLRKTSTIGVLVLDSKAQGALTISGSAGMKVDGTVIVNSTSSKAAVSSGSAGLTCTELEVGGNYNASGSSYFHASPIETGVAPASDPLATLPVPDPTTMPVESTSTCKPTSGQTLQPGVYKGGITINSQPNVTLAPGIYYLEGGGFTMSGGSSSMTANGVMLYNGPSAGTGGTAGSITLSGGGTVTMSPPTSGPYYGMAIFQQRSSTSTVTISGGSNWAFTGTVYAPGANVTVSGGSNASMGSQYISDTLTLSGASTFKDINPAQGYGPRDIRLTE